MYNFKLLRTLSFAATILTGALLAGCGASVSPGTRSEDPSSTENAVTNAERDPDRLWCNEHSVYEDECFICHPELAAKPETKSGERDPDRLWCNEHSVYEDECLICHPELAAKPEMEAGERDPDRLWCNEHSVYEDECFICHPELAEKPETEAGERDPDRLWCNEHSVYEDECFICHPELAEKPETKSGERDPDRLWCNEHSVYEDECFICHPELKDTESESDAGLGRTSRAELHCKEHDLPEMECGICHPERVGLVSVGESMKVRFSSENSTLKAGVATSVPPSAAAFTRELLGTVSFDQTRLTMVSPRSSGVIVEVLKDVGDFVEEGEIVATVQSTELAEARSALQKAGAASELARQTLRREEDLFAREISARQDLEQAQAAMAVAISGVTEAAERLESLGLSEAEVKGVKGVSNGLLPVRAPFDGTIIERLATRGTTASPDIPILRIADLSTMWMIVSVPESMLVTVQPGNPVSTRFDAYPGMAFEGKVLWVSPSIDSETRMLQARIELSNSLGLLKDGLFGHVRLQGGSEGTAMSVPASAIQEVDGTTVIFRKVEDDLYEARRVEVGGRDETKALVLAGLAPDEAIVTEGSYIVKSELLKARLGAGCAHD